MVRQFDLQRNRDLAVLIELWQPEAPATEQLENVELAVVLRPRWSLRRAGLGGSDLVIGTTAHTADCLRGPASAALLHDAMETLAMAEADHRDHLPALLDSALKQTDRGTEIVLISTRPIDLADAARFGALYADPSRRAMLAQVRSVNTADAGLAQYFVVE